MSIVSSPDQIIPSGGSDLPRGRGRSFAALAFAALLGFSAGDALQPPHRQIETRLALFAIDGYRATVSPLLARTHLAGCRFHPTCSAYGREAIARYGIPKGLILAAGRVLRCHPFSRGGEDPVP
jgi:putative membrane protein insertion efficiency factor